MNAPKTHFVRLTSITETLIEVLEGTDFDAAVGNDFVNMTGAGKENGAIDAARRGKGVMISTNTSSKAEIVKPAIAVAA